VDRDSVRPDRKRRTGIRVAVVWGSLLRSGPTNRRNAGANRECGRKGTGPHVSLIWNLAFDAGMGLGAVGFGLVTGLMGYPFGILLPASQYESQKG
jgi:hypothetical protein